MLFYPHPAGRKKEMHVPGDAAEWRFLTWWLYETDPLPWKNAAVCIFWLKQQNYPSGAR
jgi:hypothetical protein